MSRRAHPLMSGLAALALLTGGVALATPEAAAQATATTPPVTPQKQAEFAVWVANFKREAVAAGIPPQIVERAFQGVTLNARVIELDGRQAEFTTPIWTYLGNMVTDARVTKGRENYAALDMTLRRVNQTYGVDPAVAVAIWGVESNYGANYGNYSVIEALATLAFDGRRADWARGQLMEALKILASGDITPERMKGSWAGAMGHTQFIPTSFTAYAVDFTGDGKRDLWGADPSDAVASTANYLAKSKWRTGEPVFMEVSVPPNLDPSELRDSVKKSTVDWARLGVRPLSGAPLPNISEASVIQPAGARGPAFMIFPNFGVIRRYNNATSYALAVAHLADRIKGGGPLRAVWPEGDKPLSRTEIEEFQRLLLALGHDPKGVDGRLGSGTQEALRAYQRAQGLPADGYATADLLNRLRRTAGVAAPATAPVQVLAPAAPAGPILTAGPLTAPPPLAPAPVWTPQPQPFPQPPALSGDRWLTAPAPQPTPYAPQPYAPQPQPGYAPAPPGGGMAPVRSPGDQGALRGASQDGTRWVAAPTPAAPPTASPALQVGAADPQLQRVQGRLAQLGYDVGPADGRMGQRTASAIAAAAASAGLPPRGELTPEFLRALGL
ncbi:lytic murein transglycosylase [Neomegalonema sp.]|uniref:lytic murein transglycosylase n=1 Tax=Neomegalonema sp. TaxID=2039713 RepID=UPI002629C8E2|nr:lytic murein transglycosylase [Neomegalonema sp.]MDD2868041.1 lytic murein transglycosylase [Neomegalonema sp.]